VVPSVAAFPLGCRFNPRCGLKTSICVADDPAPTRLRDGGEVRCHHHG
jgi:peptide/nickel transport system ATP-binding protein